MIIHQPETVQQDGHTIVSSRIELRRHRERYPERLWFRIPDRCAHHISLQSDAFLVPGLVLAMRIGEAVEVRGTVSPRLAYHLEEYQQLLHYRMPGLLNPVDVQYHRLEPLAAKPAAVGAWFSGGVDAFFTLWKHLPQNQPIPEYRITHALFVLGFDLRNSDKAKYQYLFNRFDRALQQVAVELLPLETNLLSLNTPRLKLLRLDGALLVGAVLALGRLFAKFFIPSGLDYSRDRAWMSVPGAADAKAWINASDALADPFLSTDTLNILHHGSIYPRAEKIQSLIDWELPQQHLRVCPAFHSPFESLNCSHCEKCIRTMIPIYSLGKMDRFRTFQDPLTSNRDGLRWAYTCNPSLPITRQTVEFVRRHRPDFFPYLRLALLLGRMRRALLNLIPKFIRNRLGQYGYFVDPLAQPGAFDDPEVQRVIYQYGENPKN